MFLKKVEEISTELKIGILDFCANLLMRTAIGFQEALGENRELLFRKLQLLKNKLEP